MKISWQAGLAVGLPVLALFLHFAWQALAVPLDALHAAEAKFNGAEHHWQQVMGSGDVHDLRAAQDMFEDALALLGAPLQATVDAGFVAHHVHAFVRWLGRPLRLNCLHRIAAAQELRRAEPQAIVAGYELLLAEGYCEQAVADASGLEGLSLGEQVQRHRACLSPIARGVVQFASSPADADAAFSRVLGLLGPDGRAALGWTTRWQLPDRHTAGLRAKPFWPELPAAAALERRADALTAEFRAVLSSLGGPDAFVRRRADMWIPFPRDGWGMIELGAHCETTAPATCALIKQLRGERSESREAPDERHHMNPASAPLTGAGYYVLRPGTRLVAHSGPTNERLTCHLTFSGDGARFSVGEENMEWARGRAMCFDDSFLHEAINSGTADRYILLLDVPDRKSVV